MKKLLALPLFLAACAAPVTDGPIDTEAKFRAAVVGKRVQLREDVSFVINADNTITGDIQGRPATGTWDWQDSFWCRRIDFENQFTEDCQLWVLEGDRLIITRDRGQGDSFAWRVRG